MKGLDAEYFRALIGLESARTVVEKEVHLRIVARLGRRTGAAPRLDNAMLRQWYLPVVWELASGPTAAMTPDNIVKCLGGKLSRTDAAEALSFLVTNGYLEIVEGRYRKLSYPACSSDGIPDAFVRLNHAQMLDGAKHSLDLPIDERALYGLVVAADSERLPEIQARILEFLEGLRGELNLHEKPNTVYRIGVQAFPLAKAKGQLWCPLMGDRAAAARIPPM